MDYNARLFSKYSQHLHIEVVLSPSGIWPVEADIAYDDRKFRSFGMKWHKKWIEREAEAGAIVYAAALCDHPGRVEMRNASHDEFMYSVENLKICLTNV